MDFDMIKNWNTTFSFWKYFPYKLFDGEIVCDVLQTDSNMVLWVQSPLNKTDRYFLWPNKYYHRFKGKKIIKERLKRNEKHLQTTTDSSILLQHLAGSGQVNDIFKLAARALHCSSSCKISKWKMKSPFYTIINTC